MYLQKLEIQGFKSFAHKVTFLFPQERTDSKGVTAVVGPNGSGKSNVADAIRWVLGEQSMKLLRSKKSEDVIFYGSDKKAQLGFCEVSLFFNNEDKAFPVDYAEVVLARRLYRNGDSEFFINNTKVRLSDVSLMAATAHIGQRSYSVIGQGMIDSIINTAPADRKDFFDEAAGVKQFQLKKDASLSKLKQSRENLTHASVLVTELEPKMKFFQRQLKRLEEREALELELATLSRVYYEVLWSDFATQRAGADERRSHIQNEVDEKTEAFTVLQREFSERESTRDTTSDAAFFETRRAHDVLVSEKNTLLSQRSVIDGRLQAEYERTGDAQLAWLHERQAHLQRAAEDRAHQLDELTRELSEKESRDMLLSAELGQAQEAIEMAERQMNEKLSERQADVTKDSILSEIRELTSLPYHEHATAIERLTLFVEGFMGRLRQLMQRIEASLTRSAVREDVEGARRAVHDARKIKDEVHTRIQTLRIEIGVLKSRISSLVMERTKASQEVEKIASDLTYLTSANADEKKTLLIAEREKIAVRLLELEQLIKEKAAVVSAQYVKEKETSATLLALQKSVSAKQREIEDVRARLSSVALELARIETHQEELLNKIIEELAVTDDTAHELRASTENVFSVLGFSAAPSVIDRAMTRDTIERIKRKLEQIGTIDQEIVGEYESTKERYEFLTHQIGDLTDAIASLESAVEELDDIIKQRFETALEGINKKFTEFFSRLFNGGTARLIVQRRELIDGEDATEITRDEIAGIEIEATPPGKKLRSIAVLSGGEKALTAVALICAILAHNPSPFVVLDEVDAALDESNARRLADILHELAGRTQFIIITHNRVTMHIANVLYGVTMGDDGISSILSLDIRSLGATIAAQ